MQQSRTGLAGGVINNKIYVAGGHQGPPVVFFSSSEEYITDLSDVGSGSNLLPDKVELMQNYPNPFNPSTKIKYQIPASLNPSKGGTLVILKVYHVLGNEIETLANEEKPAGTYEITWYIESLPSGVYFYQLQAGSSVETKKMLLLK